MEFVCAKPAGHFEDHSACKSHAVTSGDGGLGQQIGYRDEAWRIGSWPGVEGFLKPALESGQTDSLALGKFPLSESTALVIGQDFFSLAQSVIFTNN